MIRIESSVNQPYVAPGPSVSNRTDPGVQTGGNNITPGDVVTTTDAQGNFTFKRMQQINDRMNQAAQQIGTAGQQLEKAGRFLPQMKHMLYQIVKMYPPYPPGDAQRIKFLRSFNGLKQELDRLTIPPDSKWYGNDMESALAQNPAPPANSQPAAAAPQQDRFGIPSLPDTASDAEIQSTIGSIDKAINTVSARQEQVASQAATIYQSQGQDAKTALLNGNSSEQADFTLPGEKAAEQKSGEVRQQVAGTAPAGLLGAGPQLAQLLG